jgi:hypothetical protein
MEYRPGEVVILFSSKEVKTIVETEKIGGVEICYMDDSTSYASTQIFSATKFLEENMDKMVDALLSKMHRNYQDEVKKYLNSFPSND